MPFLRKYNTLLVTGTTSVRIPIIKRSVVDFALGADWTPAAGDVKVFVDAAAVANITNLPTAIASGNGAFWEFILTGAELTCKQILVVVSDAATKAVEDQSFIVETYGNASAMYAADLSLANLPANITQLLGSAIATPTVAGVPEVDVTHWIGTAAATPTVAGVPEVDTTHWNGTAVSTPATAGIPEVNLKNIVNVAVSTTTAQLGVNVVQISTDAVAADNLEQALDDTAGAVSWTGVIDQGTAQSATGTTLVLRAAAAFATSELIGATILIVSATAGAGQTRVITAYNGGTDTATVDTWTTTPTGTIVYKVFATASLPTGLPTPVNLTQILGTAVSTPATAGILDVNVKNIDNDAASASGTVTFPNATLASTTNITAGTITTATNVTTVNGLAANVITATSINADAITAAKVADDVSTEIANKVLDTDMTAHQTQGTLGQAIGDPVADTNTIYKAVVTDATGATVGVDTASLLTGVVVATGGIAALSFAAGAVDAAAIAANAIGASELAQDAAREIADEVLDRDLAGGGSGNTRNVRNTLRAIRNKVSEAGGTLTVTQEDDTTPAWTAAVTRTAATDPITAVDPA